MEVLYHRYGRDVLALAYHKVGSRADAEDVAQTTFLNAHRALDGGARPANERAWLLAIARNLCHRRFRALAQRPREEPLDESHHASWEDDPRAEPSVVDAINALPPRQRDVIVLQAVHGCTTAEIGEQLCLGASAVDALLVRARAALRDELEANAQPVDCVRTEALVRCQLAGELDHREQAALRAHLRACPRCASRARSLRARKRIISLLAFPWELVSRLLGSAGPNALGAGAKVTAALVVTLGAAGVERAAVPPAPPSLPRVAGPAATTPLHSMSTKVRPAPPRLRPQSQTAPVRSRRSATDTPTTMREPVVGHAAAPLPAPTSPPQEATPPIRAPEAQQSPPFHARASMLPPEARKRVAENAQLPDRVISDIPQLPVPATLELPSPEVPELPTVELPTLPEIDVVSSVSDLRATNPPTLPSLAASP